MAFKFNPFTGTLDIIEKLTLAEIDRLTSITATAGSTLILTSDGSDLTLTPSVGDVTLASEFTADKFLAEFTTAATSHDCADLGINVAATGAFDTSALRSLFLDFDYNYNNGASFTFATCKGLALDFDATTTAGSNFATYKPIEVTADFDALSPFTVPPLDFRVITASTTASTNNAGVFYVRAQAQSTTGTITACRTETSVKSNSAAAGTLAAGYVGYAEGGNAWTGVLAGVYGIAAQVTGASVSIGGVFDAAATGGVTNKENQIAIKGASGHAFFNRGSLFVTDDNGVAVTAGCSGLSNKPSNWTSTTWGNGYIEKDFEVDGVTWMDGGVGKTNKEIATADSPYTVGANDHVILIDASGGNVTANLPAVATNDFREYVFKRLDNSANTVTIDGNASETIDGNLTYTLSVQYDSITVVCDAVEWWIL